MYMLMITNATYSMRYDISFIHIKASFIIGIIYVYVYVCVYVCVCVYVYVYVCIHIYIYDIIYIYMYVPPGRTFAQSFIGGLVTLWFVQDIFQVVLGFA